MDFFCLYLIRGTRKKGHQRESALSNFLIHGNRKLDQLKIETRETTKEEIILQVDNYYSDITKCMGKAEIKNNFN